jgi:hypothetical protein
MSEPRTKGVGFRNHVVHLGRLRGEAVVERTLGLFDAPLAQQLRERLFFSDEWYPLAWLAQLHAAARAATGEGTELARRLGYESVRGDLRGLYSVFLLVVSPTFVIGKSAKLFSTYYDTGTMSVEPVDRTCVKARWVGCAGFDENLWTDVLGGCEAAMDAAGAKGLKLTILDGGGRSDGLRIEARWR